MITITRKINKGKDYMHFKGNRYHVLGISKPKKKLKNIKNLSPIEAEHTETGEKIIVYVSKNLNTMHLIDDLGNEEYVLYVSCKDNKKWLRPLNMFASAVDAEKYPEHAGKYRFTEL